ncbi:MAG: sensor domain-containing diguanylate cyclase [Eubacterium sp.]|nr:sensor domain-containing diguanylate cyclase [Eubacterium sp.]
MKTQRILYLIYIALVVVTLGYGIWSVGDSENRTREMVPFYDNWETEDGRTVSLFDMPVLKSGEKFTLEQVTPASAHPDDVWNLVSRNIYFKVRVNGVEMYHFYPEENLTGRGYGDRIHHIVSEPPGSRITLICEPIYDGGGDGFFKESYLGAANDFNSMILKKHGFSFALSVLIIIFGILVLVMYFSSLRLPHTTYNMPALGVGVLIVGIWSSVTTMIPQLVVDNPILLRIFDYGCLAFMGYPLVVFINSVTERKRRIYEFISFGVTVACTTLLFTLRLLLGIDMHDINWLNFFSLVVALVLVILIIVDDAVDHRRNQRKTVNRALYVGTLCFTVGASSDLIKYVAGGRQSVDSGFFLQIGFIIFILLMVVQAQRRMMLEHQAFDQQQFVNNLLKYSLSGKSPDVIINQMLRYLGEESGADRTYIFEDKLNGSFANTYEWCREGVSPEKENLQSVPLEGAVQYWYQEFRERGYVYIEDIEAYKKTNEKMYYILKPQRINCLIACPLEKESGYVGFFGVDNPPSETRKDLQKIVRLLGFFLVAIMRTRDKQEQLIRYSYVDSLTGLQNRRSLEEMQEKVEKESESYGLLMCDINGLKRMNDEKGHEAGDEMIISVAESLKRVFGDRRVFRMGGDEFLVVREGGTSDQFSLAVTEVRRMIESDGNTVSMGMAFSTEGGDFDELKNLADGRMYEDKKRFYEQSGEDRRRRS